MRAATTLLTDDNNMLILTPDHVDPWPSEVLNGASITIVVTGAIAEGVKDEDQITVIADQAIVAPKGACIEYTWKPAKDCATTDEAGDTPTVCATEQLTELSPSTKLGILGDDNCVTHHITLEQLMSYVNENAEAPKLCELVELDQDQPTAGVKMLGVNESCEVVTIPANSFDCTMTDPEAFSCD